MKRYYIGAIGNYDLEGHPGNGQVIRSTLVTDALAQAVDPLAVGRFSYHDWKEHPAATLFQYVKLMFQSKNIVMFPDENALKALLILSVLFRWAARCRVYYTVIGGWLPRYLQDHPVLCRLMRYLDGLFVQTLTIRDDLDDLGISRLKVFPNFKPVPVMPEEELKSRITNPLRLVFSARVCREKGIVQLIDAVKKINRDRVLYTLDIFGAVQPEFQEEFDRLQADFPPYIRYGGVVDHLKIGEILRSYFLMVFPTMLKTAEGFPGSVLDAMCAGVPVLAARWQSFDDVITERQTGIGFAQGDFDDMEEKLRIIAAYPQVVEGMRPACVRAAAEYDPKKVIRIMTDVLSDNDRM